VLGIEATEWRDSRIAIHPVRESRPTREPLIELAGGDRRTGGKSPSSEKGGFPIRPSRNARAGNPAKSPAGQETGARGPAGSRCRPRRINSPCECPAAWWPALKIMISDTRNSGFESDHAERKSAVDSSRQAG
jgi:hypothetical protein